MKTNVVTTVVAAREKGCTPHAIRHVVKKGTLNAVREGGITLVLRDEAYARYRPNPRRQRAGRKNA